MKKKIVFVFAGILVISFLKPVLLGEFVYWDFLEVSTTVAANFVLLTAFTFIVWIVMKLVSSLTNKESIPFATLFFESFLLMLLLYVISIAFYFQE